MYRFLRQAFAVVAIFLLVSSDARTQEKELEKRHDPFPDLIGMRAPEITADFSLNGKVTNLADLKGKVVLVEFWAVWGGPCIATFPHLRSWNTDFKEAGLEIVGITSYYETLGFEKETGTVRILGAKMTKEQEHEMLKQFTAYHKLEFRLMTLDKDEAKKAYDAYKVKGIPTMVLIDREGIVRMVKVGSGEANAKALKEMIKKLLAE
jgi:peroxiredoxin